MRRWFPRMVAVTLCVLVTVTASAGGFSKFWKKNVEDPWKKNVLGKKEKKDPPPPPAAPPAQPQTTGAPASATPAPTIAGYWILSLEDRGKIGNHDLFITDRYPDGSLSGNGGCPSGRTHLYAWKIVKGTENGGRIDLEISYTKGPAGQMQVVGQVQADGTLAGTWIDSLDHARTGTWKARRSTKAPPPQEPSSPPPPPTVTQTPPTTPEPPVQPDNPPPPDSPASPADLGTPKLIITNLGMTEALQSIAWLGTFSAVLEGVRNPAVTCTYLSEPSYEQLGVAVKGQEISLFPTPGNYGSNARGTLEVRSVENPSLVVRLHVETGGCVAKGTPVTLADGTRKPIEAIRQGSRILAVDSTTGAPTEATVEKTLRHRNYRFCISRLSTKGGHEVFITGNHPVMTRKHGWVKVSELMSGDEILVFDEKQKAMVPECVFVIIRDLREDAVVYNLKTSAGSYLAGDIAVHNKCLAGASLIDTPAGPRPISSLRPGDLVMGAADGQTRPVKVTHVYRKETILPALPGRRLAPQLTVTDNHPVWMQGRYQAAGQTAFPRVTIPGAVYDLQTESGNYLSQGLLLKAGK